MRLLSALLLLTCAAATAQQAPIPMSDEINGHPYAIRDKWVIGGTGNWDYLALDPTARQLFIAHQTEVQVVDLAAGHVSGRIPGFGDARSILLDPAGQFGYVSDSAKHEVSVFDRRSLHIETSIPLDCSPRSLTMLPQQNILVAICSSAVPAPRVESQPRWLLRPPAKGDSWIAAIDTDTRAVLVYLLAGGDFRIAQADRDGNVFVTVGPAQRDIDKFLGTYSSRVWPQSIARVDVQSLINDARDSLAKRARSTHDGELHAPHWDTDDRSRSRYVRYFWLDSNCPNPQGLAVDSQNARLFVACDNQALIIMDSTRGSVLQSLTTGPGTDAITYDENRGLIYTANGGGYGSLTIVRQHQTDSYAVIQNLPTMERARTMALDPSTGQVYLVTDLHGASLTSTPANGIGKLRLDPVAGSFQVLVVGN
jgi:DNA-binding beta-propeller fold protein YncE